MARFSLAVRTSNVTNANAIVEILAGSKGCRLRVLNFTLATAVAGVFGVGRPAAAGVTPTTPVPFLSDGADASLARIALAWGTSPTAPAAYFKRVSTLATIGSLFSVSVGNGIWIPLGTTLVLFNITGGPTLDLDLEIDE